LFGDEFFVSSGVYQQATFYRVRTFSAGYHTVFFFFTQAFHLLSFLFASPPATTAPFLHPPFFWTKATLIIAALTRRIIFEATHSRLVFGFGLSWGKLKFQLSQSLSNTAFVNHHQTSLYQHIT